MGCVGAGGIGRVVHVAGSADVGGGVAPGRGGGLSESAPWPGVPGSSLSN